MIPSQIIWIAVALYLVFLLGVAIYSTRKSKQTDLRKASVSWPVLVLTYIASLMSVWVFFSGPGAYYRGD